MLAAIGIYGMMAYTVEQRRQEIGIRMALGAQAGQVRNVVVREGMTLAAGGVVAGLAGAWGLSRLIENMFCGVAASDPVSYLAVPVALCAAALVAVYPAASRVSRVDPMDALR